MKFYVAYSIERGKNKRECEDTGLIGHSILNNISGEAMIESPSCIFLCDGVGGNAGGQEASLFVCNAVSQSDTPDSLDNARSLLQIINTQLLSRAEQTIDHKTMATTATGLFITDESIILCHIGNTRLYTQRGQFLQQVTVDHTTQQWLINLGKEEEAEYCNKSEIRGAMGGGNSALINLLEVEAVFDRKVPSLILLTTDGVHEYVDEDEMEEIITGSTDPDVDKAKKLCNAALNNQSEDDRSVIIIRAENIDV